MENGLSIMGNRVKGKDVRTQNVMAVLSLANIVKSSLGPVGLDKMLVDNVGDVLITNDGATILKQLEVEHPAAKVLVELSNLQDQEVGDGTTSVVILASELLKQANMLVQNGVHPTSVISGLLYAKKAACKFVAKTCTIKTAELGYEGILNVARTSISSKIIGQESDFFAKLAVEAVTNVKTVTSSGRAKYPIASISILKAHGQSIKQSKLVDGMAIVFTRAAQGMPKNITGAKIAFVDIDLRKTKMPFGVQVLIKDPKKLEEIRQKESQITKDRIMLLINAGANVVFTTKGIDDMAMKLFVEHKVIAVRRVPKGEMKKVARATGGKILMTLGDEEGEESVDPNHFGEAKEVCEERVGDGELLYIRGCQFKTAQTIVLRGANDYMLDEVDRSLHDCLCVVKRTLESKTVVPGGGCVEAALSVYMQSVATTLGSREQLPVAAFAKAMLIIPKTLAVNGACDATELIAKLQSFHHTAQTDKTNPESAKFQNYGLDLFEGEVVDNLEKGVLEPTISKIKMIRFATEAAITILRIDDSIKMHKPQDPNNPVPDGY